MEDAKQMHNLKVTLAAIHETLNKQQATLDTSDSIISRQTLVLKNQRRSLYADLKIFSGLQKELNQSHKINAETDAITNSSLLMGWKIENDSNIVTNFVIQCQKKLSQSNCFADLGSGIFDVKDSCLSIVSPVFYGISIFINQSEKKKTENIKQFLSDTLESDIIDPDSYSLLNSQASFNNYKPLLSIVTDALGPKSYFSYYTKGGYDEIRGMYYFNTSITSKGNQPIPFSDLAGMSAIIVINSPIKALSIYLMSLLNSKGNESIYLKLDKNKIYERKCTGIINHVTYFQIFYWANLTSYTRID